MTDFSFRKTLKPFKILFPIANRFCPRQGVFPFCTERQNNPPKDVGRRLSSFPFSLVSIFRPVKYRWRASFKDVIVGCCPPRPRVINNDNSIVPETIHPWCQNRKTSGNHPERNPNASRERCCGHKIGKHSAAPSLTSVICICRRAYNEKDFLALRAALICWPMFWVVRTVGYRVLWFAYFRCFFFGLTM